MDNLITGGERKQMIETYFSQVTVPKEFCMLKKLESKIIYKPNIKIN